MAAKVYSGRELSAFCLQISILLKAAVPLDEGLYLMAEDAPTEEEKKLLHTMGEDVELGDPFFESLERTGAFPPYVVRMAKLGQQSGTLDQMMESLADYDEKYPQCHYLSGDDDRHASDRTVCSVHPRNAGV